MPRHCPFPVKLSDNRRCYRTGSAPGFSLSLLLVAVLAGYAGFSEAAPLSAQGNSPSPALEQTRTHGGSAPQ